jgi:hypothetical protein
MIRGDFLGASNVPLRGRAADKPEVGPFPGWKDMPTW